MSTAIILAMSNLATMLLTAWLIRCFQTGRSFIPSLPRQADVSDDEPVSERQFMKGRPIL